MQKWINLTEVKCDPARDEVFRQWIYDIHMPDVLDTPGFLEARQYVSKEYRDGRGTYLQIYNIETDDIDQTMKVRLAAREAERQRGRYSVNRNNLIIPVWRDVLWRQLAEGVASVSPKPLKEKWVNLVEVNCDPSREKEFMDWYVNMHMPDVLKTPGFVRARQYVMKEFRDGRGKYLHLYYIETDDIDRTIKIRLEKREEEARQGRSSGAHNRLTTHVWRDVLWRQVVERVVPDKSGTPHP
jgi:hypothetical protein